MTTTSETLDLVSTVGTWIQIHGSDLAIAVIATIVGAIISAIFDFRKHGVNLLTKFKANKADKGSVIASISNSPGAKIVVSPNSTPGIKSEEDALGKPVITEYITSPVLKGKQLFICEEIKSFFSRNGETFNYENDYARAENLKTSEQRQPSATLYIGVFNPVADLLEKVRDITTSADLKREISKLQPWSLDGHNVESLEGIITNIERIMFNFFQKR